MSDTTAATDAKPAWIFTFGAGHTTATGESLANRFVRIAGEYGEARDEMVRHFGTVWCDQYPDDAEDRAGIARFGLTELPEVEWPPAPEPWHFTFRPDTTHPDTGDSLGDRYVRVIGTYESARQQVVDWMYGGRWIAEQHYEGEAGDPAGDLSLYVMPQQRAARTAEPAAPAASEPVTAKPAGEMGRGDHIWHSGDIREVRHVEPYTHDGKPWCLIVLGGGKALDTPAAAEITIATAEDIAEVRAAGQRRALTDALRDLANTIDAKALPVPNYTLTVGGCVASRADVERWAEHLGVDVRMSGNIPVADRELMDGRPRLEVHFQGPTEPQSAPAAESPKSTEPAEAPASAHRHAAGWKGDEPGSCGVECACGLTYDGFDSLAEAAEHLDRHIAEAEAKSKAGA